jgi:hypothetical protein
VPSAAAHPTKALRREEKGSVWRLDDVLVIVERSDTNDDESMKYSTSLWKDCGVQQ